MKTEKEFLKSIVDVAREHGDDVDMELLEHPQTKEMFSHFYRFYKLGFADGMEEAKHIINGILEDTGGTFH